MNSKEEKYHSLVEEAQADPNILGLILGGGRGKGQSTEHSDYDVLLITTDSASVEGKYKKFEEKDVIEVIGIRTLNEFRDYAPWGGENMWDRYTYAHNKAIFDKTGELQKIIDEKGVIPPGEEKKLVEDNIGGYLNALYRTLKNFRDGNLLAHRLDAAESIPYLISAMFGVYNRIRPYNKFLRWELEKYPLVDLPFTVDEFLGKIESIVATGNIEAQKEFHKKFEQFFRTKDFTKTIDSWQGYRFE